MQTKDKILTAQYSTGFFGRQQGNVLFDYQ